MKEAYFLHQLFSIMHTTHANKVCTPVLAFIAANRQSMSILSRAYRDSWIGEVSVLSPSDCLLSVGGVADEVGALGSDSGSGVSGLNSLSAVSVTASVEKEMVLPP